MMTKKLSSKLGGFFRFNDHNAGKKSIGKCSFLCEGLGDAQV